MSQCRHNCSYLPQSLDWAPAPPGRNTSGLAIGSFQADEDNFVKVYDFDRASTTMTEVSELPHYFPPTKIKWRPSGDLLVTSGDVLRVWNARRGKLEAFLTHNTERERDRGVCTSVTACDWGESGIISVESTGLALLWSDVSQSKVSSIWDLGHKVLYDVAFKDAHVLAVASSAEIVLLDLRSPCEVRNFPTKGLSARQGPAKLAWSADGNVIAVAALAGGGVSFYDDRAASSSKSFGLWDAPVIGLDWVDEENVICAHEDGKVVIVRVAESSAQASFEFYPGSPSTPRFILTPS